IAPMLEEIGPERVKNEIEEAAQDAVFIEAGHRIEQRPYPLNDDGRRFVAILPGCRIEADVEKLDDTANDFGVAAENIHHIGLAVGNAGLAQEPRIGAQDGDILPVETGAEDQ